MKKLNRKGFTLIELLAVIVVLAIILVVTIPSVISSMNSAREKSFENVVSTIEDYMTKQYELCKIGNDIISSDEYNANVFSDATNCTPKSDDNGATIIAAAGYDTTKDIISITGSMSNGKYTITAATPGTNFPNVTYNG